MILDPPKAPLTLAELGQPSWRLSTRLVAHLLRSLARRICGATEDEYRKRQLPEEIAAAVRGAHREGMWAETWLDALSERWGVSLAGDADDPFPLAAWLPEGRVLWTVACRAVRRTDLGTLVRDFGSFLATFATTPPGEDDDAILTIDLPPAVQDPWRAPFPTGAGLIVPSRWTAVLELASPLAHGADTKDGNVSRFRAERCWCAFLGREADLPLYAGNAWRGQIRDLLAMDLCEQVGLSPREIVPQMSHALFSGGSIEAGAVAQGADVTYRAELRALLPLVDALGGVYRNEPMDGVLRADDGRPVCREAAAMLAGRLVPELVAQGEEDVRAWSERLPWVEDLYETRQLTRHAHRDLEGDGGQMLVRTEVLRAGVQLVHSFGIATRDRAASPLARGAIARGVALFLAGGALGAGTARGHGAFTTAGYLHPSGEAIGDDTAYLEHLQTHRDKIRDVLTGAATLGAPVAGKPPGKPPRGKGRRGGEGATVVLAEATPEVPE